MNNSNLIFDGIQLMLTGMGTVFLFLSLLVFLTGLMHKVFVEESAALNKVESINKTNRESDEEIVAITSAIHAFRNNNKQN